MILTIRGGSMRPLLWPGDRVLVAPAAADDLRPGDLVAALRLDGGRPDFLVHRLVRLEERDGVLWVVCRGDAVAAEDAPLEAHALAGRVAAVWRGGAWGVVVDARARGAGRAAAAVSPALAALGRAANRGVERLARALWRRDPLGESAFSPLPVALAALAARERAAAVAAAAARRLAWAALGPRPAAAAPAPGPDQPALGIVRGETEWSGEVLVAGDVYVAPGATLRVRAGAVVRFEPAPGWLCPHERPGWGGWAAVTDSERCSVVVAGRLLVEGTRERPVRFGAGTSWGGLHFVGDARGSRATCAEIAGSVYAGVSLWDRSEASFASCALSGSRAGLGAYGEARARVADCRVEGHAEDGVVVGGRARLEVRGGRVGGNAVGLRVVGRFAAAALDGVVVEGSARQAALVQGGGLTARGSRFEKAGAQAVRLEAGGRARLSECALSSAPVGVSIEDGALTLARSAVSDCAQAGVELDGSGARARLDGVVFARVGAGLRVAEGECRAAATSVSESEVGASVRGGTTAWSGGRVEGAARAFEVGGGVLALTGVDIRGGADSTGADVSGGLLSWTGGSLDGASLGVGVGPGGAAELSGVRLAPSARGTGAEVSGGRLDWAGGGVSGGAIGASARAGARATLSGVLFRGVSGTGVLVDGAELSAERVEWEDCSAAGLSVRAGSARVAHGRWRGGAIGASIGGGETALSACAFVGQTDAALEIRGGRATASDGWLLRPATGARVRGGALALARVLVEDAARHGLWCDAGEAALSSVRVLRAGESGLFVEERAAVELDDVLCSGGPVGAAARGGRLNARGGRFEGARTGLELAGGSHLLERTEAASAADAVRLSGGALSARGAAALGGAAGLSVAGGDAAWSGGRIAGGACGVELRGGGARLEDVDVRSARGHAVSAAAGALELRGGEFRAPAAAGLSVEAAEVRARGARFADCRFGAAAFGGRLRLEDALVEGASEAGVCLDGGAHALGTVSTRDCARAVYVAPGVRVERLNAPAELHARGARSLLQDFVLRTRGLPPVAALYRALYALPARWAARWAAGRTWVEWLAVHRSWAAGDWEAGTSDVDFLVSAQGLSGAEGRAREAEVWRVFARWRARLPFVGEALLAEPGEWAVYARDGGLRGRELASAATLAGAAPTAGRAASAKDGLEAFAESAHAYTRLMHGVLWEDAAPRAAARARVAKAALDLLRHDDDAPGASAPSRRAALAALRAAPGGAQALLALADGAGDWAAERASGLDVAAAALGRLHARAARLLSAPPDGGGAEPRVVAPEPDAGVSATLRRTCEGFVREFEMRLGPDLAGGCCDDLYRSTFVLEDSAAEFGRARAALAALASMRRERGWPATVPIVLTKSAWRIWSTLAYLEAPTRWLDARGEGLSVRRAGGGLDAYAQFSWGLAELPPPPGLVAAFGREAAAGFAVGRRFAASPLSGLSADYVAHYLRSRRMGLRLLVERGTAVSFFALEPLARLYAREFPGEPAV